MIIALACAFAGGGQAELLTALAMATDQDKTDVAREAVEAAFAAACAAGAPLGCAGPPDLEAVRADCAAGGLAACVALAWGDVDRAAPEAAAVFERACAAGLLRACVDHAALEQTGVGIPANPVAAAAVLRSACDRGEPRACVQLGKAHQLGIGVAPDLGQARVRYAQACEAGLPAGCNSVGLAMHLGIGGDRDPVAAIDRVTAACDAGYRPACTNVDAFWLAGLDGAPDAVRRERLGAACAAGRPAACGHFGDVVREADPDAAFAAWTVACDAKFARGCRGVALHRLAAGDRSGLELLGGACDVGEPEACRHYANYLFKGDGVPKDKGLAFEARALACREGDGPACAAAADQLGRGRGVPRDREEATALAARACALGQSERCL